MNRDDQHASEQPVPVESASPFASDPWTLFIISLALLLILKMA